MDPAQVGQLPIAPLELQPRLLPSREVVVDQRGQLGEVFAQFAILPAQLGGDALRSLGPIAVAALGISARTTGSDYTQTAQVVKAGKAVVVTSSNTSTVR